MAKFILLNETDVKELVSLSPNLDGDKIRFAIEESQDIDIRPLFQTNEWFQEVLTQAENNTLSVPNKYILDKYVYKIMALYVKKRLSYLLSFQYENVGVVNKVSDSSSPVLTSDLKMMIEYIKNDILALQKQMIDYIREHSELYPLFYQGDKDYTKQVYKVKSTYRL